MIIALVIVILGLYLGFTSTVFVVIPVGIVFTVSIFSYWAATGPLDLTKVAIWIGYISALNTGFLLGILLERQRLSRAETPRTKKKMTIRVQPSDLTLARLFLKAGGEEPHPDDRCRAVRP